jgi:hypothetical protein
MSDVENLTGGDIGIACADIFVKYGVETAYVYGDYGIGGKNLPKSKVYLIVDTPFLDTLTKISHFEKEISAKIKRRVIAQIYKSYISNDGSSPDSKLKQRIGETIMLIYSNS